MNIKGSPTAAILRHHRHNPRVHHPFSCKLLSLLFIFSFVFILPLRNQVPLLLPLLFSLPHFLSQYYPLLKMFNFLLRKETRKILKRKDSDAGERGTLCTLHSFLFTIFEFHNDSTFLRLTGFRLYQLLL